MDIVAFRLAPPASKDLIACKGLVLGYIQSGKTANFSATIAKAVDEGYKLIVVLAGMQTFESRPKQDCAKSWFIRSKAKVVQL